MFARIFRVPNTPRIQEQTNRGNIVSVEIDMEALRKTKCLCLNCENLDVTGKNNCPYASAFYRICVEGNITLAVTRCPFYKFKPPDQGMFMILVS